MSETIAYCGLDCRKCDAFTATQREDSELKRRIAERWTKSLNIEFKPEDIDCEGCISNKISGWCTRVCRMRPCAQVRKVKSCAHCEEYPCGELKEFLSNEPDAARTLEAIRKSFVA